MWHRRYHYHGSVELQRLNHLFPNLRCVGSASAVSCEFAHLWAFVYKFSGVDALVC